MDFVPVNLYKVSSPLPDLRNVLVDDVEPQQSTV